MEMQRKRTSGEGEDKRNAGLPLGRSARKHAYHTYPFALGLAMH